jgi:lysyl-tRNA synthetase class 2
MEVDTPLLGRATGTDIHIQSVEARVNGQPAYLQTSPEFFMKRLLAAGSGSIFQICHAFRDEELGRYHRAEFSLLEWYSVGLDYHDLMDEVEALICHLSERTVVVQRLSYNECFENALGINPGRVKIDELRQKVAHEIRGVDVQNLEFDDCLDLLISQVVAPGFDGFTFVYDYPASQAALARLRPGSPALAERFELFHNAQELANGFSELIDDCEQRARFLADNALRRQRGLCEYPIDEAFLAALASGDMPECAGVALGLDRLLMVLQGFDHIDQVSLQ